jgi:hypothetical protein
VSPSRLVLDYSMDYRYRLKPPCVTELIASCLNDACRHTALIYVSSYSAETEVPYFRSRVVCAKCGSRGNKIDVLSNWKERPAQASLTGKVWR